MMNQKKITSNRITKLKKNQIFVFGSNLAGIHGAGAARDAIKWGAEWGIGYGLSGNTFALPTKDKHLKTISLEGISVYVDIFINTARNHPEYTFLVTEVGCGLAGYSPKDIAPLFKEAIDIPNISLPKSFWNILTNSMI